MKIFFSPSHALRCPGGSQPCREHGAIALGLEPSGTGTPWSCRTRLCAHIFSLHGKRSSLPREQSCSLYCKRCCCHQFNSQGILSSGDREGTIYMKSSFSVPRLPPASLARGGWEREAHRHIVDHGVLLHGRRWLEEGGKAEGRKADAEHPHTPSRAKAQRAPTACVLAAALPGCLGAGFAGECLPWPLAYFGGCGAKSPLSWGTASGTVRVLGEKVPGQRCDSSRAWI